MRCYQARSAGHPRAAHAERAVGCFHAPRLRRHHEASGRPTKQHAAKRTIATNHANIAAEHANAGHANIGLVTMAHSSTKRVSAEHATSEHVSVVMVKQVNAKRTDAQRAVSSIAIRHANALPRSKAPN